ncbi:MAG: cytochrome C [Hyphomonas sp.]|nr:cytochrome C [Hyphomonas sp.]|tara:strand:- start:3444 stop:3962 length:519 start_codon:yes stop_codon:yes gene_type:complete
MTHRKTSVAVAALLGLSLLAACGSGDAPDTADTGAEEVILANGMTPKEQIDARQAHLKNYGKAFKTISDQLKASDPDMAAIQTAAANLVSEAEGMETWFPEGSGPDSGVKTDALPAIWESPEEFNQIVADFQTEAAQLSEAAQTGDVEAIKVAFGETGQTCKSCHETYRADD